MSAHIGTFKNEVESLSPEILLKIFLNLESHETVILRSVSKEFLEIIDNNKSLWRVLDWIQQNNESAIPALEMFDEKSASTLKEVSIFQEHGAADDRVLQVLDRSKSTLVTLSLKLYYFEETSIPKLIELASDCRHLESLVLWCTQRSWLSNFPRIRLTRSSRQSHLDTGRSSNLQVLWSFQLMKEWNGKVDVSSLVSFADPSYTTSLQVHSFIGKFSTTLIHLSINFDKVQDTQTLSCPCLRILESRFSYGFPSWLDSPNLQIVIASSIKDTSFFQELPISVEEIWLSNWYPSPAERCLEFLPQVCPKLKVLKFGRQIFKANSESKDILKALRGREAKVQEGVKLEGIQMVSLEKLIVPTDLFTSSQLAGLKEIVREVIDIKDYPDFIELEY